jgi:hypothetical protein
LLKAAPQAHLLLHSPKSGGPTSALGMWDRQTTVRPGGNVGLQPHEKERDLKAFRPGFFDRTNQRTPKNVILTLSIAKGKDLQFQRWQGAPFKPSVGLSGIITPPTQTMATPPNKCHPERSEGSAVPAISASNKSGCHTSRVWDVG